MKYLILIGVVVGLIWWIKFSRPTKPSAPAAEADHGPQPMVRCAHCGLHLPQNEAIDSANAVYCSQAHRDLAEPRA